MVNQSRVLIGCSPKENNKDKSNLETEYLFKTLSKFGGSLTKTKKIACLIEKPDPDLEQILNGYDVSIRIVPHLDDRCPTSHKIRVLEEASSIDEIDYIVLLDTDIVLANDFSEQIFGSSIRAKPADMDFLSLNQWKNLFKYFELDFPLQRLRTCAKNEKTIPYFNSGVMIIPYNKASSLFESWKKYIHKLCDYNKKLPNDQIALSLAIVQEKIFVDPLPLSMNFPSHIHIHSSFEPESIKPFLIHYHNLLSNTGEIWHCPYSNVNKKIDEINQYLTKNMIFDIEKNDMTPSAGLINYLITEKKYQDVIQQLSNLPLESEKAILQYFLALSLAFTGQKYDEALERYNVSLKNGFNPFMIYFNRGCLYLKIGNINKGREDLNKALELEPNHIETNRILTNLKDK